MVKPRIYRAQKDTDNVSGGAKSHFRNRNRTVEKQAPIVKIVDHNDIDRVNTHLQRQQKMTYEPFDGYALATYQFRETNPEKWRHKHGFKPSGKAPDMAPSDKLMNQTGTDCPYTDGFEAIGYQHYRKRLQEKEYSEKQFNRFDKSTKLEQAFVGPNVIGSLRQHQNYLMRKDMQDRQNESQSMPIKNAINESTSALSNNLN